MQHARDPHKSSANPRKILAKSSSKFWRIHPLRRPLRISCTAPVRVSLPVLVRVPPRLASSPAFLPLSASFELPPSRPRSHASPLDVNQHPYTSTSDGPRAPISVPSRAPSCYRPSWSDMRILGCLGDVRPCAVRAITSPGPRPTNVRPFPKKTIRHAPLPRRRILQHVSTVNLQVTCSYLQFHAESRSGMWPKTLGFGR